MSGVGYIFFVLLFCVLHHRLVVRISLPFHIFLFRGRCVPKNFGHVCPPWVLNLGYLGMTQTKVDTLFKAQT